jgi:YVTN family beta-propeller protein
VAYDSAKGEIFVSNAGSNTVSVISDSNNAVVATVAVGGAPDGLAYDSAKGEVFVSNHASNTVSVISDSTNTVVANITIASSGTGGSGPAGIAYDPTKGELYVADSDSCLGYCPISSNTVSVISDSSNKVVANVTVGEWPSTIAFDATKDEMFVGTSFGGAAPNNVTVISDATNAVVANLVLGNERGLGSMVYDPANGLVLATTGVGALVYMISDSANAIVGNLTLGGVYGTGGASGVVYDSGKGVLFVSDGSSKVFVVSGSAASTTTNVITTPSTTASTAASSSLPVSYILLVLIQVGVILGVMRSSLGRKRKQNPNPAFAIAE